MSLYEDLAKIGQQVRHQLPQMKNHEKATINASVMPFVRALGYDTQDLSEVYPEYAILNMDAVDLAVLRDGVPVIFVEAKSAGNKLRNKEWKQLFQYFNAEVGLRFGILTNGVEYRFYTDLKADNIMDKEPFLTLEMLNLDERLVAELEGFTKVGYDAERVVAGARKRVMARLLKQEMNSPSDDIARHFAKQLTSKRLSSDQLSYYAALLGEAWRELSESSELQPKPNGDSDKKCDPEFIHVYGENEGHRFEAEMLRTSLANGFNGGSKCLRFDGRLTNAKDAMIAAIRTVDPSFSPGKNQYGLGFWHVIDPVDGTERPLLIMSKHVIVKDEDEALRQRVLSS